MRFFSTHRPQHILYSLFGLLLLSMSTVGTLLFTVTQEKTAAPFQGLTAVAQAPEDGYNDALLSKTIRRDAGLVLGNGCHAADQAVSGVCGERFAQEDTPTQ